MPMYCAVVSAIARRFLAISTSSATFAHLFWRLSTSTVHARRPTMPSVRNNAKPFKDGLLMPPERPWIDSCMAASCHLSLSPTGCRCVVQITLKHELQFHVSHNGHIRCRSSCLICTLPTADDVGGRGGKTGRRLMPARLHVCWAPRGLTAAAW